MIDLRSDTFTVPDAKMREIIAKADVGDDVFGEDPSCNALEAECAKLLGKEAAVFAASGTMGNLLASMVYSQRTPMAEIVIGKDAHVMRLEVGGIASVAHASTYQLANNEDGTFADLAELKEVVHRAPSIVKPTVTAVFLENTYGTTGGKVLPMSYVQQVRQICDTAPHKVSLHCDGARLWNAAIALNLPLHEVAAPYDTVQVCLSKGLGAPVGSVLAGPKDFIDHARLARKTIGGGMRQAGLLASAGLYAIQHNYEKLRLDHEHATLIADYLEQTLAGHADKVHVTRPETNMAFVRVPREVVQPAAAQCKERGVLIFPFDTTTLRMVPNLNHTREDIEKAMKVVAEVLLQLLK